MKMILTAERAHACPAASAWLMGLTITLGLGFALGSPPAAMAQDSGASGKSVEPSSESSEGTSAPDESRARIAADLEYFSSDAMRGRDTGSPEIDQAAQFIADRFAALGLNTKLYDGTPFQQFTALSETAAGPAEENSLTVQFADGRQSHFVMDRSIRPLSLGGSGTVSGPLVFVGYGISAPEHGYDDYAGVDVEGKIVVVLRGEPRRGRDDNPFSDNGPSRYAYFTTKVATAIEKGAAGLLMVNHAEAVERNVAAARKRLEDQEKQLSEIDQALAGLPDEAVNSRQRLMETRGIAAAQLTALRSEMESAPEALLGISEAGQTDSDQKIPVASLGRQSFAELLATVGGQEKSLAEIEATIDETLMPRSMVLPGVTATLRTAIENEDVLAKNVIAELPGVGALADETVVIGAHYDHVGMGGSGSLAPGTIAIHNGADDNASGTVMMLELARRLSQQPAESRRRIVFMAFTAEEKGLLGSRHYVREPRFALEDTVAMINLDMVGRLNDEAKLTVYGVGSSPEFDSLIDRWNAVTQLPIRKDESGFGPSDHTNFYEQGIPVLFFFTGLHSDYHRPSDDFGKINLDGMVRITDIVTQAAQYLATVPERPEFRTTGPGQGVGRREQRPSAFLGIQMEPSGAGARIMAVVPDSPAAEAGLAVGDLIIRVDDQPIESLDAVQRVVGEHRPGDVVPITVIRSGAELAVRATLEEHP